MVFNHVSYTDGIALGAYFLPCGVAKASVADIPFFGVFTKARPPLPGGCLFRTSQLVAGGVPSSLPALQTIAERYMCELRRCDTRVFPALRRGQGLSRGHPLLRRLRQGARSPWRTPF